MGDLRRAPRSYRSRTTAADEAVSEEPFAEVRTHIPGSGAQPEGR